MIEDMSFLERLKGPRDLDGLSHQELEQLAGEIRTFLIEKVSRTGGHLGPNLGVVELTLALHRVFNSPQDPIIFDTGHQAYVHKMLTGRSAGFDTLRQSGGLSGYPARSESCHDWLENSHASGGLSFGAGMAEAFHLTGEKRTVVVVVGDGALTGGMAWEALNNIAERKDLTMVIVVNDNGRSYMPTVGGLAKQLSGLRTDKRYEQTLDLVKRGVKSTPLVGNQAYDLLHGLKVGLKDVLSPQGMFADLGLKYVGPINGHDLEALERSFTQARSFRGPVIVHCITQKGKGFAAAELHEEDQFHSVGRIDASTGESLIDTDAQTWTSVFGSHLVELAEHDDRIVAITAAMLHPTGLAPFATRFPERVFDVGIAEQHAVASAAGLATAGLHPVVAVYATFMNRAFDQVLLDVALHNLGVTFVLDRAGITGNDGASHNGMWDMSLFGLVPNLQLAAPRDEVRLKEALARAVKVDDAPTLIRFSKEPLPALLPAIDSDHGLDVLFTSAAPRVLVVGYGAFVPLAIQVGTRLDQQGIGVRVIDPVWALPFNPSLCTAAQQVELVVSIEDNLIVGGLGSRLQLELANAGITTPVLPFGIPQQFLAAAKRGEVLSACGLNAQTIARTVIERISRSTDQLVTDLDRQAATGSTSERA